MAYALPSDRLLPPCSIIYYQRGSHAYPEHLLDSS